MAGHGGYPLTLAKTLSPALNCLAFFIFKFQVIKILKQVIHKITKLIIDIMAKIYDNALSPINLTTFNILSKNQV